MSDEWNRRKMNFSLKSSMRMIHFFIFMTVLQRINISIFNFHSITNSFTVTKFSFQLNNVKPRIYHDITWHDVFRYENSVFSHGIMFFIHDSVSYVAGVSSRTSNIAPEKSFRIPRIWYSRVAVTYAVARPDEQSNLSCAVGYQPH